MADLHWVDELPPVEPTGLAGPKLIYFLFPESSPLDLEPLSAGSEVEAQLGGRKIRLTKAGPSGRPWLDPETNELLTTYRAAQLGFTPTEGTP